MSAAAPHFSPHSIVEQRLSELRQLLKVAQEQFSASALQDMRLLLSTLPLAIISLAQLNEANQIVETFVTRAAGILKGKKQHATLVIGETCTLRVNEDIADVVHACKWHRRLQMRARCAVD
jgi:hypothetical protein